MRAETKGKHEIRKRFAIVIGVAAVGVMALGAQTVMAGRAGPGSHDAVPTAGLAPFHGGLGSEVRKCVAGRRVFLFKQRPGPDRKLGSDRNHLDANADPADPGWFTWLVWAPLRGRIYAKVRRKVGDGFVCRADRSPTYVVGVTGGDAIPPGRPPSSTGEPPAVVKYETQLTITRN